jgi:hypothetical protein
MTGRPKTTWFHQKVATSDKIPPKIQLDASHMPHTDRLFDALGGLFVGGGSRVEVSLTLDASSTMGPSTMVKLVVHPSLYLE